MLVEKCMIQKSFVKNFIWSKIFFGQMDYGSNRNFESQKLVLVKKKL